MAKENAGFYLGRRGNGEWYIQIERLDNKPSIHTYLPRRGRKAARVWGYNPLTLDHSPCSAERAKRILDKAREGKVSRIVVTNISREILDGDSHRVGEFKIRSNFGLDN